MCPVSKDREPEGLARFERPQSGAVGQGARTRGDRAADDRRASCFGDSGEVIVGKIVAETQYLSRAERSLKGAALFQGSRSGGQGNRKVLSLGVVQRARPMQSLVQAANDLARPVMRKRTAVRRSSSHLLDIAAVEGD